MERYTTAYWMYVVLGPLVLGLIALVLILLPGEPRTVQMLIGLAVYLALVVGGGVIVTRRLDR